MPLILSALARCTAVQEEVWHGPQLPRAGVCEPPATATLVLRGRAARVTPGDGTLVLAGQEQDGTISAALETTGTDRKPYKITFSAHRRGPTIDGTLTTPRCRYDLHLTRVPG